jgi:hypothetical protein
MLHYYLRIHMKLSFQNEFVFSYFLITIKSYFHQYLNYLIHYLFIIPGYLNQKFILIRFKTFFKLNIKIRHSYFNKF